MLLLHQVGSVKIGEVVRYTVTYTPSQDRILPPPERLFLRVRNTTAIAFRAAFVHGPYTLSVAAYPANFDPNEKFADPRRYGVPEYEPMLKASGSWECQLVIPEELRQSAGTGRHGRFENGPDHDAERASWIIEVSSQVIFSPNAAVGYEVVLARDEKSLNLTSALPVIGGQAQVPQPGKVSDHQQSIGPKDGRHPAQPKGVFSRAIHLKVEDTGALWNTPKLPSWNDASMARVTPRDGADVPVESVVAPVPIKELPEGRTKKVHLVVLTHGLHSNLGVDMLFLKESIDSAVKQAKVDAKVRRARERARRAAESPARMAPGPNGRAGRPTSPPVSTDGDDDTDEEVIVRGFSGNATKTERGIKYLGKRLARYVLSVTYPDQPFLPSSPKTAADAVVDMLKNDGAGDSQPAHKHSSIHKEQTQKDERRPYKFTKISFIAHSLGGLVQTYAIAYIQKHSPQFFDVIEPINFITLATPFLGLSNENPLYVKFALDFGLVGRTGQDLGLTWRAPTIARNGWGALVGNLGESAHKKVMGDTQPESKPLLRILPTGPAHEALRKFRNRTVYSNVVNDGIVPLRTSCLLFLDWHGLDRVEKARRDAGLVETMVGFGWAELTGASMSSPRRGKIVPDGEHVDSGYTTPGDSNHDSREVPQPPTNAVIEDDRQSMRSVPAPYPETVTAPDGTEHINTGPLSGFFSLFRRDDPPKSSAIPAKQTKMYKRSQTLKLEEASSTASTPSERSRVTTGHEFEDNDDFSAPPRTTFFESASDLINPKVPSTEYLIDPSKRPRTIFHDRIYHPTDIPPPPLKPRPTGGLMPRRKPLNRTVSQSSASSSPYPTAGVSHQDSMQSAKDYDDTANTNPDREPNEVVDGSNMRVEEKIARAYHRDLSWRKVLVKLEPDAHNNIIVRRMFANAYGWPVIKHLTDAHFSDSVAARTRDDDEDSEERAMDENEPADEHGRETKAERHPQSHNIDAVRLSSLTRTDSENREAEDTVPDLPPMPLLAPEGKALTSDHMRPCHDRMDLAWSERDWDSTDAYSDLEPDNASPESSRPGTSNPEADKGKDAQAPPSSPVAGWNWTEKIAGKGVSRNKSRSPAPDERGVKR